MKDRNRRNAAWRRAGVSLVIAVTAAACAPSIPPPVGGGGTPTIDGLSFVPATWNPEYVEESPYNDDGGLLHVRVDNPLATTDRVTAVTINGTPVDSIPGLKWWRVWPPTMSPAGSGDASSVITVKGISAPLRAGETITVRAETQAGQVTTRTATLRAAAMRVGSVVVSQDRSAVYLFVRNRGARELLVDEVALNEQRWRPGDPQVSTPGGTWAVAPDRVLIVRVDLDAALAELAPLAVQVGAAGDVPGGRDWVMAPIRVVEPTWAMGTWNSELPGADAAGHRAAKGFLVDQYVGSARSEDRAFAARYGIRINAQRFSNPNDIVARRGDPTIRSWLLSDEPDLGNEAEDSSAAINARVLEWRELDPTHPMWVNFAMQRKFNEYGQIPDITGMDHYVQCAPNAIFGTNWARLALMEEALDYTDALKDNTEPTPMWIWPQLGASSAWNCQPDAWGVSTQFWSSVMGGADGINWFVWQAQWRNDPRYAEAYAQGARDVRVARQVAGVLTYGEIESSSVPSNPRIRTRTVVGLDAQVVIACNLDYAVYPPAWSPTYYHLPSTGTLEVEVPTWIDTSTVRRVGPSGTEAAPHTVSGRMVSIPVEVNDECAVFTIGARDTTAPSTPTGVTRAETDTLAWADTTDDTGVAGYRVLRDDVEFATTDSAVFQAHEVAIGSWTVQAVDSAGNVSPPSAPAR